MQVGLKTDTENISFVCLFVCFFYFPPGKNKIKKKERKKERRRERERERGGEKRQRQKNGEKEEKLPKSGTCAFQVQCCFTSTETIRTMKDGEPRTAISTFTQLLSSECLSSGSVLL